jgi:hypothetical protein
MDKTESIAKLHLSGRGYADIVYEPQPNQSPDFLVNGRIAVEVRRLNQNFEAEDGPVGLESAQIAIERMVYRLVSEIAPPPGVCESWWVMLSYERPLRDWIHLRRSIRRALVDFRNSTIRLPQTIRVSNVELEILRLDSPPDPSDPFLQVGSTSDDDTGGFIQSELVRNINICIDEKTRKIARVHANYPSWWLLLVEHMHIGISSVDGAQVMKLIQLPSVWDKLIIVSPTNGSVLLEIP